tara:strand:- start:323 stop:805 length:483 start_codon:yes stop_codon:yes gene_type:complete
MNDKNKLILERLGAELKVAPVEKDDAAYRGLEIEASALLRVKEPLMRDGYNSLLVTAFNGLTLTVVTNKQSRSMSSGEKYRALLAVPLQKIEVENLEEDQMGTGEVVVDVVMESMLIRGGVQVAIFNIVGVEDTRFFDTIYRALHKRQSIISRIQHSQAE